MLEKYKKTKSKNCEIQVIIVILYVVNLEIIQSNLRKQAKSSHIDQNQVIKSGIILFIEWKYLIAFESKNQIHNN